MIPRIKSRLRPKVPGVFDPLAQPVLDDPVSGPLISLLPVASEFEALQEGLAPGIQTFSAPALTQVMSQAQSS
jgi:hypothetical protein